MTHVHIERGADASSTKVLVDGFDLTPHLYATPFNIMFHKDPDQPPAVMLSIAADEGITVDLPEAIILALRETEVEV